MSGHRITARRQGVTALALTAACVGATQSHAAAPPVTVSGSVFSPACVEPSTRDFDPATSRFECDAMQRLVGDWAGIGHVHATGTVDPISGDARGRFTDVLDITLADGTVGSVRLVGTLSVDGATGVQTLQGRLDRGTGALRGAVGTVRMSGFSALTGGPALGNYQGRWHQ